MFLLPTKNSWNTKGPKTEKRTPATPKPQHHGAITKCTRVSIIAASNPVPCSCNNVCRVQHPPIHRKLKKAIPHSLLFHTVRLLRADMAGRKCGRWGSETNRQAESKISRYSNPRPCFLGRLHPGLRFPGSIVSAKIRPRKKRKLCPVPTAPLLAPSRNVLFPPPAGVFSSSASFSTLRPVFSTQRSERERER